MTALKGIIDDLGGGKSLSLGAVLCVLVYVGSSEYVASVERRLDTLHVQYIELEHRQDEDDRYHGQDPRFTVADGEAIRFRLERLERHHGP